MVTVVCNKEGCSHEGIEYTFWGAPERVECGSCHEMLTPTDHRDDPPMPQLLPEAPQ